MLPLFAVILACCGLLRIVTALKPFAPEDPAATLASAEPGKMTVRFDVIDVGQGSALLVSSGGEYMLVDGGGRESSSRVAAYLKERGVTELRYIAATHYDEDHLAGLVGALAAFPVQTVLAPDYESDTRIYASFCRESEENGAALRHPSVGDFFRLGDCGFTVLADGKNASEAENDRSLALRFSDGTHSLLVCGDAEAGAEEEMLRTFRKKQLQSEVYIVSHHGSSSSSSEVFLAVVQPRLAVISCGKDNDYGHPHRETLERLAACGAEIRRTDEEGDIVIGFFRESPAS